MCLLHLCSSTWIPKGDYVASNTDECTSTLSYAVSLKKPGSVSFQYFYPDSHMFFEFYVSTVASPELFFKEYTSLKALWSVKLHFLCLDNVVLHDMGYDNICVLPGSE